MSLRQQLVPGAAPDDLDDVPAGPAEDALQLLDDLAVAPDRAVQALQVAVDDEDQVVQPLPAAERDRPQRLRLVGLAVAQEGPDLAAGGVGQPARPQVLEEPGLVDRHQRAKAHRHRRELPVVGHQPRVRVRRQPAAVDLLAEPVELGLGQPSLQERPGVDAGRDVALEVDQVPAVVLGRGVPEVVEAGVVHGGRGLEAGDVPAQLRGLLVGPEHDGQRVPAGQGADLVLKGQVARVGGLLVDRDGVHVRGGRRVRRRRAPPPALGGQLAEQEPRPVGPLEGQHRVQRVQPLPGLDRVHIVSHGHRPSPIRLEHQRRSHPSGRS